MTTKIPNWFLDVVNEVNPSCSNSKYIDELWDAFTDKHNPSMYGEKMLKTIAKPIVREFKPTTTIVTESYHQQADPTSLAVIETQTLPSHAPQAAESPALRTIASTTPKLIKHSPATVWQAKVANFKSQMTRKGTVKTFDVVIECPHCTHEQAASITQIKSGEVNCNQCLTKYTI